METATQEHIGAACTFVDPVGKERPALITAVWGPQCVNVVYVNDDKNQGDTYGRKIERSTSVMHRSLQQAHGNYWFFEREE